MLFFVITKNLNLEILSKNFLTFKSWDGVKDEHFQYYGGSLKNPIFRRGDSPKTNILGGIAYKGGGGWGQGVAQLTGLRGGKKEGMFLTGRGVIPLCTPWLANL